MGFSSSRWLVPFLGVHEVKVDLLQVVNVAGKILHKLLTHLIGLLFYKLVENRNMQP